MADELEEINGIKPKVWLPDGEEREVSSQTSNSVYKVKRTWDHYYCTCPAWRNQGGAPVNARTCKHLKALLGDAYENARIAMKNPDGPPPKGAKAKPPSKAKPASKAASKAKAAAKPASKTPKRKRGAIEEDEEEDEDEDAMDEDEEEEEDEPPAKRSRKAPAKTAAKTAAKPKSNAKAKPKPAAKGKGKAKAAAEEDDELDEDEDDNEAAGEDDEDEGDENPASGKNVPELLLANKWDLDQGPDPTGWWVSEKLDGVRTFYDGSQFISRLGNPFTPPNWFLDKLPTDVTLDGELYGGRGKFQDTVSIVKTANSIHWSHITFKIFDVPSRGEEPFEARYDFLQKTFGEGGTHREDQIEVVQQELVGSRGVGDGREEVLQRLKEIEAEGGEGLMLRRAASQYEGRRSGSLLKIKTFYDAEAIVIGHAPGKGRNKGTTGALKCKMQSGKLFSVGSGLTDKIRKAPPKVGTIVCYRFQELTRDGVPRFPSFVGVAIDKTEPKDAEIRKTGGGNGE